MGESSLQQFESIVADAGETAHAHLCVGDSESAVIWDPESEITIRLSLRDDEVWLIAGSGMLIRFVAASDGTFDLPSIADVIGDTLAGNAREHFGAAGRVTEDVFATGYRAGSDDKFTGGLTRGEAAFAARIAGPMAVARLDVENENGRDDSTAAG